MEYPQGAAPNISTDLSHGARKTGVHRLARSTGISLAAGPDNRLPETGPA